MKFLSVVALAGLASAQFGCKPGTYACTPNARGWMVCNTSGIWVVSSPPPLSPFLPAYLPT